MRYFIAVLKVILFLIVTLFYYSIIAFGNLFSFLGIDKIKCAARERKKWAKVVARILGMNILVKGMPPKAPFFLVSNHLSYVDVWLLFSQLNCTFIAKSEVRKWPVIGFILATTGILFVNRSKRTDVKRVNDEISGNLTENQGIVLFAEATTSIGADILPFKSSLFEYPAANELPVSCATISYKTEAPEKPAYQSICWWDDTPFIKHIFYLFVMKEFTATVTFSSETVTNSNRKILARSAEGIVKDSFEPVIDSETYAKASIGS